MREKKRVIERLANQTSTMSDRTGLSGKARFVPATSEDILHRIPDEKHALENLRLEYEGNSKISAFAHSRTPLIFAGGEIRTTIEPRKRSGTMEDRRLSCLPGNVASGCFELLARGIERLVSSGGTGVEGVSQ